MLSMGRACRSPQELSKQAMVSRPDSEIQLQPAFVHAIVVDKSVAKATRDNSKPEGLNNRHPLPPELLPRCWTPEVRVSQG